MAIIDTAPVAVASFLAKDDLVGDVIQAGHPFFGIIWVNAERMSGTPCFAGTRVPVQSLFDHLEAGDSIDTFLTDFPPVTRTQVVSLLELGRSRLMDGLIAP